MVKQAAEKQATDNNGANSKQPPIITVSESDLPVHCHMPDQTLWNQHPRVFMAFDKDGHASCPYCGNRYQLIK
ncbi:MAG: zinc-finger domain-containing protein [Kangiella sp.]|nr:zinc-finger domain-containing protein [Kangiella sp.]